MIRWAVAAALLCLLCQCCPSALQRPPCDTVPPWLGTDATPAAQYPRDTVRARPVALYRMVIVGQLAGSMTLDSVTHWSTAGGEIRIERLGKPGPLVYPLHIFSIAAVDKDDHN